MEVPGGGMVGRLAEKVIGWVALGGLVFLGIAIYQMPGETKAAIWSGIWRSAAWLVAAAAIPWSATLFIRRILEIGSNWAGLGLVAAFCVLDVVVALVLMTGWPDSGWAWAATLGALGLAGTYNFLVAEYLAERSS